MYCVDRCVLLRVLANARRALPPGMAHAYKIHDVFVYTDRSPYSGTDLQQYRLPRANAVVRLWCRAIVLSLSGYANAEKGRARVIACGNDSMLGLERFSQGSPAT